MLAVVSLDSTALGTVGQRGQYSLVHTRGTQAWDAVSRTCVNISGGGLASTSLNVSFVIARRSLCTASKCSALWREPLATAATLL